MGFINGWTEIERKGKQMIEDAFFGISRPEGCTCPSHARVVMISHDYIEMVVSKDCTVHAVLLGNMEYDQYIKLKREYASDNKRTDNDRKLLWSKIYNGAEEREIWSAKKRVQEAAEKLRILGVAWRGFLVNQESGATYLRIAGYVNKIRYERNMARSELRDAERSYRMAVEVPFLRRWKLDKIGRKTISGVYEHGASSGRHQFLRPGPDAGIKIIDPIYMLSPNKPFLAEELESTKAVVDELKKIVEKVYKKRARPMANTSLRHNLRKR